MRLPRLTLVLIIASLLLGGLLVRAPAARAAGRWLPAASMIQARYRHTATLLPNGQVLVAGGLCEYNCPLASVERYDPSTDRWLPATPMSTPRAGHWAILLPTGQVFVLGGAEGPWSGPRLPSAQPAPAEVYDPDTDTWTPADPSVGAGALPPVLPPSVPGEASVLLPDGQILAIGAGPTDREVQRYDPATNTLTPAASMLSPHGRGLIATRLRNGQVLVAGGLGAEGAAERYDPATDTWSPAGTLPANTEYSNCTGVLPNSTRTMLPDGQVLVTGGALCDVVETASTALYDPVRNGWVSGPAMSSRRSRHTATRLLDGRVLVIGGLSPTAPETISALAAAEIYSDGIAATCFLQTDTCVRGRFLAYWQEHGGLAVNGYPLSDEFVQVLEDGRAYQVQYFERTRLEYHPENPAPFDILLGQFGRRILAEAGRQR